jgi:hypothetical protein
MCPFTIQQRVILVEQELPTFRHPSYCQSLVFCVVFCWLL